MVDLVDGEKQDWGIYLEAHASKEELERKGDKDYRDTNNKTHFIDENSTHLSSRARCSWS